MSYDVSIGSFSRNYTSNVSALWYDHIPDMGQGGGLRELHGLTGAKAVSILADAFAAMNRTRHSLCVDGGIGESEMSAKYDSRNGWGSMVGAIIYMGEIMGACAANPRKKVHVCC